MRHPFGILQRIYIINLELRRDRRLEMNSQLSRIPSGYQFIQSGEPQGS